MNIVTRDFRCIEVDNVRNLGDIQTTRHNIGGYKHANGSLLELAHCAETLVLRAVGVNYANFVGVTLYQMVVNSIGHFLRAHEYKYLGHILLAVEQVFEEVYLGVEVGDVVCALNNLLERRSVWSHLNADRVSKKSIDKVAHILRKSCRKHKVLAAGR